ncbi:GAF domain-containing protein [Ramlibacter pallidus]|uniref:GAF domain-containing protein n=1 Tax=Ramlibacter pallidus TaxID=2780087 RepID=A0ABR9S3L1_9BURK|nr:GAF domain-containing protein [Ramlibacter pallidus]MBE7368098.1 GAF domain-containing protein [Ramlibacter pallidus]
MTPAPQQSVEHPDFIAIEEGFAVATADGAQDCRLARLSELLEKVREQLKMDVVFVSQFVEGSRVLRWVRTAAGVPVTVRSGDAGPREESYCQKVVDGRLPQVIRDARAHPVSAAMPATQAVGVGAHLSVPIRLSDGTIYGTVCCFSHRPFPWLGERDAQTLRAVADVVARVLERPRVN